MSALGGVSCLERYGKIGNNLLAKKGPCFWLVHLELQQARIQVAQARAKALVCPHCWPHLGPSQASPSAAATSARTPTFCGMSVDDQGAQARRTSRRSIGKDLTPWRPVHRTCPLPHLQPLETRPRAGRRARHTIEYDENNDRGPCSGPCTWQPRPAATPAASGSSGSPWNSPPPCSSPPKPIGFHFWQFWVRWF